MSSSEGTSEKVDVRMAGPPVFGRGGAFKSNDDGQGTFSSFHQESMSPQARRVETGQDFSSPRQLCVINPFRLALQRVYTLVKCTPESQGGGRVGS